MNGLLHILDLGEGDVPEFTDYRFWVSGPRTPNSAFRGVLRATDSIFAVDELGFGHGMTNSAPNYDTNGTTARGLVTLAVLDPILLSTAPTMTAHDISRSCHARQSRSGHPGKSGRAK
jgi:hypothetical protein